MSRLRHQIAGLDAAKRGLGGAAHTRRKKLPVETYGQIEVDWNDMRRELKKGRETERMDGTWRKGALFGEFLSSLEEPGSASVPDLSRLSSVGKANLRQLEADARKYLGDEVEIVQNESDLEATVTTRWPDTGEE